jgi:hypothetical protein
MPFSRQVYASVAQAIDALTQDASSVLLEKHVGSVDARNGMRAVLEALRRSPDEAVGPLIAELVSQRSQLRHSTPTRHVFDSRVEDLERWLFHDGLSIDEAMRIVSTAPAVEETTGIRDQIFVELAESRLDSDRALEQLLNASAAAFVASPPDFNEATSKVRIALETVARRAAQEIATRRGLPPPNDSWGAALHFLRAQGLLTVPEENAIASHYTLISPGAHRPIGFTEEEWARLSRTFALSATFFLLRQYRSLPTSTRT